MKGVPMRIAICLFMLLSLVTAACGAEEVVGKRPYEMDWANRFQDDHPPLVDFENLDGWTVKTEQLRRQHRPHARAAAVGQVRRQVHLPRDRRGTDLSDRTTGAGEDRAAVRRGEPVGVWQQLVVRPQREHADGVDHREVPRCAGTRGERAADHRGVGGVVPVQPASDPRADRDGQGRRELRGAGHWQRAQQGRPRAVL